MILSVSNQKGGVGKTTSAINISAGLALKDKKVLLLDLDPQGNATSGLGIEKDNMGIYDVMINGEDIENVVMKTDVKNLYIIPSNIDLSGATVEMVSLKSREMLLKNALSKIKNDYDYIIIDCPPSLSMLTINSMTTANSILVPIQCEYYALEGLSDLLHTVNLVQERLNPELAMEGVVFTMFDARTNLSLQVVENVKENLNQTIYKSIIPRNVRLAEAPSYGKPINLYDPKSAGAESYMLLAEEVINKGEE